MIAGVSAGQIAFSPQTNPIGQQPNATTKRYIINGTVVNSVTGAPVSRAIVRLQGMEPAQTFTGEDGRFELKDVPEGRAFLTAERPGFQLSNRLGPQQVTVNSSTSAIQLKMVPQSSLRGHVRNSDGEPVESVQVQVFRRQVMNGVREWMPANTSTTDETGAFEIDDLAPGAYLLQTHPHRVFIASASVVVDGRHFPDLYPAQYYPNAPDRASAQPIQIQPGTDAQTDITLVAVPSYSASGTINTRNAMLSCESSDGEIVSSGVRLDRKGTFTIMQLPSGPCTLRARTGGGQRGGEAGYAELPINIASTDLTGLQLNLEALPDIPLLISDGGSLANTNSASGKVGDNTANTGVNVQLIPVRRTGNYGFPTLTQNGNSKMFTAVTPGVYHLSTQAFGGSCVGSVSSGSLDLLRSDFTVVSGGSPAPIDVTLRKDCGSLTAKVEGPNSTDPISVVLVPQAAPTQAKMMRFTGGTMQFTDLTPGDYVVYAAPDLTDFAYTDPEVLKGIEGQKVTVGPNSQATIQLQMTAVPGGNQ